MKKSKILLDGIINNNPSFKLVLGTCATLALTNSAMNGIGMGLTVTIIITLSNMIISLLRKIIPSTVRIPCYVVIIATLVTVVRMVLYKFMPDLYDSMGIFLPLIVVNCILLGRAEAFASKNNVVDSALDGIANGIGFTLGLTIMAIIREFLGSGSFFGLTILEEPIGFFATSAGSFFVYGICIALFVFITDRVQRKMRVNSIRKELESKVVEYTEKETV